MQFVGKIVAILYLCYSSRGILMKTFMRQWENDKQSKHIMSIATSWREGGRLKIYTSVPWNVCGTSKSKVWQTNKVIPMLCFASLVQQGYPQYLPLFGCFSGFLTPPAITRVIFLFFGFDSTSFCKSAQNRKEWIIPMNNLQLFLKLIH